MAKIIENPSGRRMIKLSTDDIFMVVSLFQQKCNAKTYTQQEAREVLSLERFYLPEEVV